MFKNDEHEKYANKAHSSPQVRIEIEYTRCDKEAVDQWRKLMIKQNYRPVVLLHGSYTMAVLILFH